MSEHFNFDDNNSYSWEDVNKTWDYTKVTDTSSVTASGHGSVAAGAGITGTVTTGTGDAVGNGAAAGEYNVTGSGNALGDGSAAGDGNAVANGDGSTIGSGNTVANGDHAVQGDGNVTGDVSGHAQVATTDGTAYSASSDNSVHDSGNTDLHSFGAGDTNTIGDGNTSSAVTDSGNTSNSGNTWDSGNTSEHYSWTSTDTTSDSYDDNGPHISDSALGNSWTSTHENVHVHVSDPFDGHVI